MKPFAFTADHALEPGTAPALDTLFGAGSVLVHGGGAPEFSVVRLPDFVTPDGTVVASDGLIPESSPFVRGLAPGAHPLRLVIAKTGLADERIAFALLGELTTVASFELALVAGQTFDALKPGNYFGYPVDSGVGSFASAGAHARLNAADDYTSEALPVMHSVQRPTREWCSFETEVGSAALFSSGYGDGLYASYFGLDAAGAPVVLVTDFGVAQWPRCPIPLVPPAPVVE